MSINLFFRFGTSVLHFPEKIEHRAEDHKIHGNGEIGAELVIRHSLTAVHDNVVKAQVDIRVGHGVKISAFKPFSEHFVKILGEMEFLRRPCFQIFRKAVNVFAGFFIIDHFLRNDVKKLPALFKIEPDTSFGYFFAAINGNNAL